MAIDAKQERAEDFRPIPFWSWNDDIPLDELEREIRAIAEAGLGGFFIHARCGLAAPYLGEKWFEAVDFAIRKGREHGLDAWIYDENGWPSGTANGEIPMLGKEFQQKRLCRSRELPDDATPIARIDGWSYFYRHDSGYVDWLDRRTAVEFLARTHERYKNELSPEAWREVRGFFIDEAELPRKAFPWAPELEGIYARRFSRNLADDLPALFEETQGSGRIRRDFWRMVAERFHECCFAPIAEWCRNNGKQLTGHLTFEEDFPGQIAANGAAMPHYAAFSMPGIDWLGATWEPEAYALLQLDSAASQFGKRRRLAEDFGCAGWELDFGTMRWIAQLQLARGVNCWCPHLLASSLRGRRKRDCPPSLFTQQPWWREFRQFADELTEKTRKLNECSSDAAPELLVLHSLAGLAEKWNGDGLTNMCEEEKTFRRLTRMLEDRQILFHYGDEELMERFGAAANGRLKIGGAEYSAVLVPPGCGTLSQCVRQLLESFLQGGGKVLCHRASQPPLTGCTHYDDLDEAVSALEADYCACPLSGERTQVVMTRRILPAGGIRFYFANRSKERPVSFVAQMGASPCAMTLPPAGDALWEVCGGRAVRLDAPVLLAKDDWRRLAIPTTDWRLEPHEENALVLDNCRFEFNGAPVAESLSVIDILPWLLRKGVSGRVKLAFEFAVGASFPLARILSLGIETPEFFTIALNGQRVDIRIRKCHHDRAISAMDLPPLRRGRNIIELEADYAFDDDFDRRWRSARDNRSEMNRINFPNEFEPLYLLGDFAAIPYNYNCADSRYTHLSPPFVVESAKTSANLVHLEQEGLAFYSGRLTLQKSFTLENDAAEECRLELRGVHAHAVCAALNGRPLGTRLAEPCVFAVPANTLRAGENVLGMELAFSLRNLFGPHQAADWRLHDVWPARWHHNWDLSGRELAANWDDRYLVQHIGVETISLLFPE